MIVRGAVLATTRGDDPPGVDNRTSDLLRDVDRESPVQGWKPKSDPHPGITLGAAGAKLATVGGGVGRGAYANRVREALLYSLSSRYDHEMERVSKLPSATLAKLEGAKPAILNVLKNSLNPHVQAN